MSACVRRNVSDRPVVSRLGGRLGFEPPVIENLQLTQLKGAEMPGGRRKRLKALASRLSEAASQFMKYIRDEEEGEESFKDGQGEVTVMRFRGRGAHDGFVRWSHRYPRGFVVNCTSDYWMLHRANCSAFVFRPDTHVCLTLNLKVCSEDRDDLKRWASKHGGTLRPCSRCAPG